MLLGVLLINDHTLSVSLRRCGTVALITSCGVGAATRCVSLGLLADDVEHTVLESLFIFGEPVLLPGVVKDATIKLVSLHAAFEEVDTGAVVWFLFELERTAVLHKLPEFAWVASAQLLK